MKHNVQLSDNLLKLSVLPVLFVWCVALVWPSEQGRDQYIYHSDEAYQEACSRLLQEPKKPTH